MPKYLTEIENEFLKEVEKNGGGLYHDYSNPLHFNYVQARLGGKSRLQQNHAYMFKLLEKTKAWHIKNNGNSAAGNAGENDGLDDSMKVRAIYYDTENLISDISSDHTKTRPSMAVTAKIMDMTDDKKIVATAQVFGDEVYALFAEMKKKTSQLIHSNDHEFRTVADFWWLEDSPKQDVAMNGYTTAMTDFKVLGTNSIVDSFVVNAPIPIKTPGRDHVVVVYNRAAVVGEDYDYSYVNSPHDDLVDIYLPASATVTLNPDWKVLGLNKDMGFKLQIEDIYKGVVNYYGNGGFDSIQTVINNNVITFTFQDNRYPAEAKYKDFWANALNIKRFSAKTTVNIYCQVQLDIQNSKGLKINIPVVFQSKEQTSTDKSIAVSKPILIQWGCVGKDTLIQMADGGTKAISKIRIGDIVVTDIGESLSVVDIYSGREKTITLLETTGGKKVLLTSGHPVATERGVIPAIALNAADKVKTVDGYEGIADLRTVDYNDRAYGLRFADPHLIPCNGIILGDFGMQQLAETPLKAQENAMPAVRSKQCQAAKAEFRQMFQKLPR